MDKDPSQLRKYGCVMFDGMKCRSCHRFPSPFYRFISMYSHLLCAYCVNTKFETNGGYLFVEFGRSKERGSLEGQLKELNPSQ